MIGEQACPVHVRMPIYTPWMALSPAQLHTIFEAAAYFVGFRWFLRERKRLNVDSLADGEARYTVIAGAVLGAAIGAKLAYWSYDPAYAFADFPDWRHLLEGKSIIGALLGGLIGVETAKRMAGIRTSTGDAFVHPLAIGMIIGRAGCFLSGLDDHTYGNPTSLPWGVDFGDGIPRHPTQLYEVAFLLVWVLVVIDRLLPSRLQRRGDRFRVFLAGYLAYRLLIEFIRPAPFQVLGLGGLQWWCVFGLAYYARDMIRIFGKQR